MCNIYWVKLFEKPYKIKEKFYKFTYGTYKKNIKLHYWVQSTACSENEIQMCSWKKFVYNISFSCVNLHFEIGPTNLRSRNCAQPLTSITASFYFGVFAAFKIGLRWVRIFKSLSFSYCSTVVKIWLNKKATKRLPMWDQNHRFIDALAPIALPLKVSMAYGNKPLISIILEFNGGWYTIRVPEWLAILVGKIRIASNTTIESGSTNLGRNINHNLAYMLRGLIAS